MTRLAVQQHIQAESQGAIYNSLATDARPDRVWDGRDENYMMMSACRGYVRCVCSSAGVVCGVEEGA